MSSQRPHVPPVAWFAVALWAGAAVTESVSWAVYRATSPGATLVGVMLILASAAVCRWRVAGARAFVDLACAGLVAGMLVSATQGLTWHRQVRRLEDCGAREWTGAVEADPMPGAFGATVRVRLLGGPLGGARVRVRWPEGAPVPELGRTVRFSAIISPLPPEEEWARRVARTGACGSGSAWSARTGAWRPGAAGALFAWRAGVLETMHGIPGVGGDLLEGIVLGDRRRLAGTAAEEDFRVLGLTHLVAVSGSHLALACGAVALAGSMLRMPRRPLIVATVLAGGAYAIVTGMAYSALRSLVMLALAGTGQLFGRRGSGVASLAVAVAVVLALEPWSAFDVGFQLSALAVAGLLLFGALATEWVDAAFTGPLRAAGAALALTLVAQAVTVPVIASCFGMVSLLAPVANVWAGPLVSVALWLGLAGSVVSGLAPEAGVVCMRAAASVLGAAAWIAGWMSELPGAAVAVGAGVAITLVPLLVGAWLWARWPRPASRAAARRLVALVVCANVLCAIGPAPARQASLVALDVGQGDALLLRDGGRAMLVDSGPDDESIRRALARAGVRRADVVVLTHAHDDHTGGVGGLAGVLETGWIGVPGIARREVLAGLPAGSGILRDPDSDVRSLAAGQSWMIGQTRVEVLWPPAELSAELGTNDTSVVLALSRGGFDAVLTGDAEAVALAGIEERVALRPVEVLKIPHHGSDNGLTEGALAQWDPRDALISVGAGNTFGHPCASTLAMLESAGVCVWRTDHAGDVIVRVGEHGYSVVSSASHGTTARLRARMGAVRAPGSFGIPVPSAWTMEATGGGQRHRGTQARVSDLRSRGSAARARGPPPA